MATRYLPIQFPIDTSELSSFARQLADFVQKVPTATPLNAAQHFNCDMIDIIEAIEEIERLPKL